MHVVKPNRIFNTYNARFDRFLQSDNLSILLYKPFRTALTQQHQTRYNRTQVNDHFIDKIPTSHCLTLRTPISKVCQMIVALISGF